MYGYKSTRERGMMGPHFETIGSVHNFYKELYEENGATLEGMGHLDIRDHEERLEKALTFSGWRGSRESVLDIGCGIGMLLRTIRGRSSYPGFLDFKYTGIDVFKPFVDEAKGIWGNMGANKTFVSGDWGVASKVISNHDHVFALGVINFRPNHTARRLLEAMWKKANKSLTFTFHNHAPFDIEHFNPYHFFYEDVGGYTISFYMNAAGLEECMVSVHKIEDDEKDEDDHDKD